MQYINEEWLNQETAEHFLACYLGHSTHLGQLSTSRNESAHWLLKRDLQVSTQDLLETWISFDRTIQRQHTTIKQVHEDDKVVRPLRFVRHPLFQLVLNQVSSYVLGKVMDIKNHYLGPGGAPFSPECSGQTMQNTGMPCIHCQKLHG